MASTSSLTSDKEMKSPEAKQPRTESESEEDYEWQILMEDIYTQQHFGTTADEIVDTIFNLCLQHFTALLPSLKKSLVQLCSTSGNANETAIATTKIDAGVLKYVEKFYSRLERNSDAMLLYLKNNIISVPEKMVLPQDQIQLEYKELVKFLHAQKQICNDSNAPDYTEENTVELLTKKSDELYEQLLKKKLEKAKLEHQIKQADSVLARLNSLESLLETTLGEFPGSLREFVLKNISAAVDLPVVNGTKLHNGTM